ncbi:hypothetical protein [Actinoplanes sp. G11-F43]|uniref:hypothetical protein n=1 Tax=Actinoplanes sp. G11-F43 TaxID=3424130 RepID=UPI003D33332D
MYDQYQPPADPNAGAIALTARYHWMTFILGLFRPKVAINGHPSDLTWGRTVIPLPAGQYHVGVHVPYLLPPRIGVAETVVPVYPGQVVEVEYRAPVMAWIGGSIGPPPQRYRGMSAGIALMIIPLVALLCVCGLFGALALTDRDTEALPSRPTYTAPARPTYSAPPPPTRSAPAPDAGAPTLRSTPARTLVGPSYAAGDETYTMAISGVPFAFRTPPQWGCLTGKIDIQGAKAWVCIHEGDPFDAGAPKPDRGKRLQFMLRPCPGSCAAAVRADLSGDWFDAGAKPVTIGRTSYVETARNAEGRYTLDMSHFITDASGANWQLAVGVHSQPASKAVVQKIVNDMFTQAG